MLNTLKNGHYKGLYLLFFVEMWERFSYYGMRALIVLYMIQSLMFSTQHAGNIYGLYTGFVYLTPLIGGYLADRFLGQRKCVTIGALLMSCGLFMLAFGHKSLFYTALFFMIVANGFFKSNISSILGLLYAKKPEMKDSAYTIFYMGINLGAFFSPLICGTLALRYGYQTGFGAAGLGMLIGLAIYKLFEKPLLGTIGDDIIPLKEKIFDKNNDNNAEMRTRLLPLFLLMFFTVPFWVCFEQAGISLTLFAQYQTNRNIFGFEIPTGYFQSLNPMFIIILAPLMSLLWERLRNLGKEPASVQKFAISHFLMATSYVIMVFAGYFSMNSQVSIFWLVAVYFVMTVAELCISPIGLSLVSKLAPKKFLSVMMGCWFLTSFAGNLIAGYTGGKYNSMPLATLFSFFALLSAISCLLLLVFIPKFNRVFKD